MQREEVRVRYIAEWTGSSMRIVLIETADGKTYFPIITAAGEADYLNQICSREDSKRPTPYDLVEGLMEAGGFHLQEVYIYKVFEGVFFTRLQLVSEERQLALESRVSDAVILAIRNHCPVYADKEVLERVGVASSRLKFSPAFASHAEGDSPAPQGDQSVESLERMLQEAVEKEDFESASSLRDRIRELKGNG